MIDRIPPQSLEVERIVLGTCLIESGAADIVVEKCTEDYFYSSANRKIFSTIREIISENKTIDMVLLIENLRSKNILEEIGDASYIAELSETICTIGNLPRYISILKIKSKLRVLISTASEILEQAFNPEADPEEIIQDTEQKFLDITTDKEDSGFKKAGDILPSVLRT